MKRITAVMMDELLKQGVFSLVVFGVRRLFFLSFFDAFHVSNERVSIQTTTRAGSLTFFRPL
jgi:hypothetical protein